MFCALSLTFPRLACWCWWEPCHLARGANTTGQTLFQHIRIQTWLSVIPVQPVTSLLGATCRPQHQSDVSSRCQHQVGMTAVHLVVPACLPVHPDFFPGCTSPPVAVTGPHGAAPWPTAHTAAGGGRSKHTARKKRIIRILCWISGSSLVECVCVCVQVHTPDPELSVCLAVASDRESLLCGRSTAPSPHTPPGRATPPSSGDFGNEHTGLIHYSYQ